MVNEFDESIFVDYIQSTTKKNVLIESAHFNGMIKWYASLFTHDSYRKPINQNKTHLKRFVGRLQSIHRFDLFLYGY